MFSGLQKILLCPNLSMFYDGRKKFARAMAVILIFTQISFPLHLSNWVPWFLFSANAVLYSPDTKVPRTGELALRKAIPANSNMKAIQVKHVATNLPFHILNLISYLFSLCNIGFFGGYLILVKNTPKKALWYNGKWCEEGSEGAFLIFSFYPGNQYLKHLFVAQGNYFVICYALMTWKHMVTVKVLECFWPEQVWPFGCFLIHF